METASRSSSCQLKRVQGFHLRDALLKLAKTAAWTRAEKTDVVGNLHNSHGEVAQSRGGSSNTVVSYCSRIVSIGEDRRSKMSTTDPKRSLLDQANDEIKMLTLAISL
jgi:hypothetical protein